MIALLWVKFEGVGVVVFGWQGVVKVFVGVGVFLMGAFCHVLENLTL